jgi:hypothetical protein
MAKKSLVIDREALGRLKILGDAMAVDLRHEKILDLCVSCYGQERVLNALIRNAEHHLKHGDKTQDSKDFWSLAIRGYKKILEVCWGKL